MTKLTQVKGIGKVTAGWLEQVGIHSLEDIQALGVVEVYLRLKAAFPEKVTLNALWGLEGVANGRDWREIPEGRKAELRALVETAHKGL